jgi:hypothetical protein
VDWVLESSCSPPPHLLPRLCHRALLMNREVG